MTATATIPQVAAHEHSEHQAWHERRRGQPPLSPAAAAERMRAAQAFRIALGSELNALCADAARAPCESCTFAASCDRMLSTLLIRMLNAAVEQVAEENALLARYRTDPRHARSLAAHAAAHDQLINDLGAHVMDWGRRPPGQVRAATSALLKYWTEAHAALHDEPLIALATAGAAH